MTKKIGILDPEGKYKNPLTGKKYSERYRELSKGPKGWSEIPVYEKAEKIIDQIKQNRVIVLESGTGSGKTVLIPKFALHALDYKGKIVVTNPKKVTTESNARYNAGLLDVEIGKQVGFRFRNAKLEPTEENPKGAPSYSKESRIIFATDGTVVQTLVNDPKLTEYDIVIVDEAHERSTGIDEIFLYMRRALRLNLKLKLIVMSATLPDANLFLDYFGEFDPDHIVLPSKPPKAVEVIYSKKDFFKKNEYIEESKNILFNKIIKRGLPGDVLIFVTSKPKTRTLRDEISRMDPTLFTISITADSSEEETNAMNSQDYKNLGDYSRKVIIATNVIESSATIDGLKFVIDPGMELKSGFDPESQQESLKTQVITKAQADQRKGRVGRTATGTCFRLYTKKDFENMVPTPTVAMQSEDMTSPMLKYLSSGQVEDLLGLVSFVLELIEPPGKKSITNSIRNLTTMDLVSGFYETGTITEEGKDVYKLQTRLKLDTVAMARSLLYARFFRCEREMIVLLAVIRHTSKGISSLFFTPDKKDKSKTARFNKVLKKYHHRYGDIFSFYFIYIEFIKNDKRMLKGEIENWARENFLRLGVLRKINQTAREIFRSGNSILDEIAQIDESYKFKNRDEASLFCLAKGHSLNIARLHKRKYKNIYPEKKTEAGFDDQESFMKFEKNLPKYIFYLSSFVSDRGSAFINVNLCPQEMVEFIL